MLVTNSPDTASFSDLGLLQVLSSHDHRPNVMILNKRATLEGVLKQLSVICQPPLWICQLPGALDLPVDVKGTLALGNIDQ